MNREDGLNRGRKAVWSDLQGRDGVGLRCVRGAGSVMRRRLRVAIVLLLVPGITSPPRCFSASTPSVAVGCPWQHFFICPLPCRQPFQHQLPSSEEVYVSQPPPHFPLPTLIWCCTAVPLGSAVSLVCQEEEASLDASADPLPLLTGAPLQPGGHIRRTEVLPPGSSHESQRGQENGLLSGRRLPPRQLPLRPSSS